MSVVVKQSVMRYSPRKSIAFYINNIAELQGAAMLKEDCRSGRDLADLLRTSPQIKKNFFTFYMFGAAE
jgi:hypothetical protein